jgi:broad specificity phosphatase PhoE
MELVFSSRLLLVRHGHVADNTADSLARMCGWADPPLSPMGQEQVTLLVRRLADGPPIAAVYTSPLRRAVDTAAPLARLWRLRPRVRKALREIGCGSVDGWLLDEVKRCFPDLWQAHLAQTDELLRWPGGETYQTFRARALSAIQALAMAHPGQRVAVVTHAGVITQIIGALTGTSAARWSSYRAGNASMTEILWRNTGGEVVCFDDRAHLSMPARLPLGPSPHYEFMHASKHPRGE